MGTLRRTNRSANDAKRAGGILMRLLRSSKAATLPMIAAAIIPLMGIIGSALDMSRIYLVKTRLQQACDAGALAARRSMSSQSLTQADIDRGQNFFSVNLTNGAYGSRNVQLTLSNVLDAGNSPTGAVSGRATAEVPLTLLRIFFPNGVRSLTANCQAQLNITNNDVMFVLDVTGSMSCLTSDSAGTCQSYSGNSSNITSIGGGRFQTTEKTSSRIDGLRAAVENFAKTLSDATPTTARLRIGFVPYSSGVSVGRLLQEEDSSWMNTSATYRSRTALFDTPDTTIQTYPSNINAGNCVAYGNNASFVGFTPSPAEAGVTYSAYTWNGNPPPFSGSGNRQCRRLRTKANSFKFTQWNYSDTVTYDLTTFLTSTSASPIKVMTTNLTTSSAARVTASGTYNLLQLAQMQEAGTASGMTLTDTFWDGCIVERTDPADDIDTAPDSSPESKWTPAWKDIVYTSSGARPSGQNYNFSYSCPKAGMRMFNVTSANLDSVRTFVNVSNGVQTTPSDFVAHGYTYHDIGMIWGVRLMSTSGLFAEDFGAAPNGRPVNRHIIFMTDGDMQTSSSAFSAYGIESSGDGAHNTRFLAACEAAKDRGISVWVVSFAQALTTELTTCADTGQAFQANDTDELNQMFQTIAQRIAELRLVS